MKKLKRIVSALLCAAALCLPLSACGGGSAGTKDVSVEDLTAAVNKAIGKDRELASSDGAFLGMTRLNADQLGDHAVLINVYGANIDEYGVFQAGTMSAAELKDAAETYLEKRRASWMDEYMPEEKPKLTNAEVHVKGDYVMYCILSDADKSAAFKAFEDALK